MAILPHGLTEEQINAKQPLLDTLQKQPVINGVDANVFFQTDEIVPVNIENRQIAHSLPFVYMDNIFTIQLTSSQSIYPVYNNTEFNPNSFYTTKDVLAGIIVYSQSILDIYEHLKLKKLNNQQMYILPQIVIEFIDRNKYTYRNAPRYNINSFIAFNEVYLTYPALSITPDASPIQLISRFISKSYEVLAK